MKPHHALTSLTLFLALSACVSIDINPSKTTRADDYDYSSPGNPFEKIKAPEADYAWQSEKSGNTIAIITACNKNAEPSLKSLENDIQAAMTGTKVLSSQKLKLQNVDSLKTHVEGQVETATVQLLSYSLRRNNCSYSLTYVGRKSSFNGELSIFEKFVQGFELE